MNNRTSLSLLLPLCISLAFTTSTKANVSENLAALMDQNTVKIFGIAHSTDPLQSAYKTQEHQPLWTDENGANDRARSLIRVIADSETDGLVPLDYLSRLPENWQDETPAKIEIAFSTIFTKFARDLSGGRTTAAISEPDIVIKRKEFDLEAKLADIRQNGLESVVAKLRPTHPQYARLTTMLKAYRQLVKRGGWPEISKGKTLKPDMVDPRVVELRRNMAGKGYNGLLNSPQPDLYDEHVCRKAC